MSDNDAEYLNELETDLDSAETENETLRRQLNEQAEVIHSQGQAIAALKREMRALGTALCNSAAVALNVARE